MVGVSFAVVCRAPLLPRRAVFWSARAWRLTDFRRLGKIGIGHQKVILLDDRLGVMQPTNKNVPTNPLLGGTVGSRGSFLLAAMPKGDLKLSYFA